MSPMWLCKQTLLAQCCAAVLLFQVFRIFISSLSPERVLGLPGIICTIGAAREKGHENADIPVHVYGPPGLAAFLTSVFEVS